MPPENALLTALIVPLVLLLHLVPLLNAKEEPPYATEYREPKNIHEQHEEKIFHAFPSFRSLAILSPPIDLNQP